MSPSPAPFCALLPPFLVVPSVEMVLVSVSPPAVVTLGAAVLLVAGSVVAGVVVGGTGDEIHYKLRFDLDMGEVH